MSYGKLVWKYISYDKQKKKVFNTFSLYVVIKTSERTFYNMNKIVTNTPRYTINKVHFCYLEKIIIMYNICLNFDIRLNNFGILKCCSRCWKNNNTKFIVSSINIWKMVMIVFYLVHHDLFCWYGKLPPPQPLVDSRWYRCIIIHKDVLCPMCFRQTLDWEDRRE